MRVHEVEGSGAHQAVQPADPARVEGATPLEAVDRDALGLEVGDEGVLPGEHVRDLDVEAPAVDVAGGVHDETFGAATPKALGQPEHPDRLGRARGVGACHGQAGGSAASSTSGSPVAGPESTTGS